VTQFSAKLKKLAKDENGQGMTEYIIIVALVAIAAIAVIKIFGKNLRNLFGKSAASMTGEEGSGVAGGAQDKGLGGFTTTDK
jgi:Flp pilus assembly pilin Flp